MKNYRKGSDQRALTVEEYEKISWFLRKTDITKHTLFQIGYLSSFFYTEISRLTVQNLIDITRLHLCNDDGLLVYDYDDKKIYIEPALQADLKVYLEHLRVTFPDISKSSPAFYSTRHNPIRHDVLSHYVYTLCDQLKIERFHLRKTFFTNLLNRGVPLFNIQRYLKMQNASNVLIFLNISPTLQSIRDGKKRKKSKATAADERMMRNIQENTRNLLTLKYELADLKKTMKSLEELCDKTLESLSGLV